MDKQIEPCRYADSCRYGYTTHGGGSFCIYMIVWCRSRWDGDPKGEIKDGRCGYYEDWSNERSRHRAQNRKRNKK